MELLLNINEFFKTEFPKGFTISENCKIVSLYNYYYYPEEKREINIIMEVCLNNKNTLYNIDWYIVKEYTDIKLNKILKVYKDFKGVVLVDEYSTKINDSTKYKIYHIVKAWLYYNNYLINLNKLGKIKETDNVLF